MAIPFALPLQSQITDENKLAASENVPDSLGDIALAGDNIEFKPEIEPNYSVVGTPTIENNIVSGFNSGSCLTTENPFIAEECTGIEIVLVFEVPAAVGVPMIANAVPGVAPYFRVIMGSSGSLAIRYTDTLGEEKIASTRAFITANTKNWYKAVYDASAGTWTHYNSTDEGVTWTQLNRVGNYSNAPSLETGNLLYWGKNGENQGVTYFNGKIYLEDCYIKTTSISGEKTLKFFKETGKTTVSATVPEVDLTGYLKNLATGTNSFSVNTALTADSATSYGVNTTANGTGATSIGYNAKSTIGAVAVGINSEATVRGAVAIGPSAKAKGSRSIQIGYGTNSEDNSVYVSTSQTENWKLLGSDGKIPAARLPDDIGGGYKSLDETQKTQLLLNGTYNGADVVDGEVFTEYDGKFVKAKAGTTTAPESFTYPYLIRGAFGHGGRLVTTPNSSSQQAAYSDDHGVTWTTFNEPFTRARGWLHNGTYWLGLVYQNDYGTVQCKVSVDGITWSSSVTIASGDFLYSYGVLNGVFYVCTTNSDYTSSEYYYSENGTSWTKGTKPADVFKIVCRQNDIILLSKDGKVFVSTDGQTWEDTGVSYDLSFSYGWDTSKLNCLFEKVYFTWNNNTVSSKDLSSWSSDAALPDYFLEVSDSFAIGVNGTSSISSFLTTTDGEVWTSVSLPASMPDFYTLTTSGDGYFYLFDEDAVTGYKASYQKIALENLSYNKAEVDAAGYLKNVSQYSKSLAIDKGVIGNSYGATEIAIGSGDQDIVASGQGAIAIGSALPGETYPTKASGQGAIAIGKNAQDTYELGLAIGFGARVNNRYSIALGANAETPGYQAIALGYHAKASAGNAIQIGYGTNSTANTMNVGLSNSLNVQLLSADGTIPAERLVNAPAPDLTGYVQNTATGTDALTLLGTATNSTKALNIGVGSQATNVCTTVVGNTARASGGGATAIGCNARATAYCATAIGGSNSADASYASSTDAIALGHYARATADSAIQIGYGENNTAHTLAIGLSHSDTYTLLKSDGTIPGERMSLQGTTAPDTTTVGSIGQFYVDTTTSTGYMCVGVDTTTPSYTWKQITYSPVGTEYILEAGNWNTENNFIEISIPDLTIGTPMWIAPTVSEDNSNELNYTTHGIRLKAQQADSIVLSCTIIPTENISITIIR